MTFDSIELVCRVLAVGGALRAVSTGVQFECDEATHRLLLADIRQHKADVLRLLNATGPLQSPIMLDFETRSLARLPEVGGRRYAQHDSTEVLCAVFWLPDGEKIVWTPPAPAPVRVLELISFGVPIAAHNALGFERHIWMRLGWPAPRAWVDTMQIARIANLPAGLDALAHHVLGEAKDRAGRELTLKLSRTDAKTGLLPHLDAPTRSKVVAYCERDVEIMARAWSSRVRGYASRQVVEREADRQINDRGFLFDSELARSIVHIEHNAAEELKRESALTGTELASPKVLARWLRDEGYAVSNVRRESIEPLLEQPDLPDTVRCVLLARLASSGIVSRKLRTALESVSPDGRLRDTLVFHSAHTGRWGGRGFQPQNLPRGTEFKDGQLEPLVHAAKAYDLDALRRFGTSRGMSVIETLALLVRPCIMAPSGRLLAVVDFSSIEARALLWLASDEQNLDLYRRHVAVYEASAAALLNVPVDQVSKSQRQLGKVQVLGCGFGVGPERFAAFAASLGVNWNETEMTPTRVVEHWRDRHPLVAGFQNGIAPSGRPRRRGGLWRDCEAAMHAAFVHGRAHAGRCMWNRDGRDVICTLPSGRMLVYPDVALEERATPWGGTQGVITYRHRSGRTWTWGGKLAENVTQAVCRDLLAHLLVELDKRGLLVVLHVHDEVVVEVSSPDELEEIKGLARTPPPWAQGLPLAVTGSVEARYHK